MRQCHGELLKRNGGNGFAPAIVTKLQCFWGVVVEPGTSPKTLGCVGPNKKEGKKK
jgi:hypothetical protein